MTWLQSAIVFLKLIIYIDTADIEELNQTEKETVLRSKSKQRPAFQKKQIKKAEMNLKMTRLMMWMFKM